MKDTLFICIANVQRSQVAEGLYNHYSKESQAISCAGAEASKDRYFGKAEKNMASIVLKKGVDIRNQNINYITDFTSTDLDLIKRVIFLYDPLKETKIDKNCLIKGKTVYEHFSEQDNREIIISAIKDPYQMSMEEMNKIYKKIDEVVKNNL